MASELALYSDQSARELQLFLLDAGEPVGLQVLAEGRLRTPALAVRAAILGSSHFVAVTHGSARVAELVACAPPEAELATLAQLDLAGTPRLETSPHPALAYRFSAERVALPGAAPRLARLRQRADAAAPERGSLGLCVRFPRRADGRPAAETVIAAEAGPGHTLRLATAHSYPNEGVVVFSRSRFRPT